MTEREKFEANERKAYLVAKSGGRCEVCGDWLNIPQLAHRIPRTKMYLKKYGPAIVHHDLNLAVVCSLRCNSAVNIGMNPAAVSVLVDKIKAALDGGG
jgi:hypothetical protein